MKYGDFQFIITRAERQFQFIEQQVHLKLSHLSLSAVDDARMHWLSPFLNPDHIHVTLVLPIARVHSLLNLAGLDTLSARQFFPHSAPSLSSRTKIHILPLWTGRIALKLFHFWSYGCFHCCCVSSLPPRLMDRIRILSLLLTPSKIKPKI